MNKKEVSEIKRIYTPERCSITKICGCYVNGEKDILTELKESFLSLPESEMFKYLNLLKAGLSGTIEKNLINLDFPSTEEEEGGRQEFLMRLRKSHLKDDLVTEFYRKVIDSYDYGENYYIVLIHCLYDIPSKAADNTEMFDASDYVYDFIQCVICPVKLSEAGLCYDKAGNTIKNRDRDWLVQAPVQGFLFPAFNDRDTDIHSTLYFTKKTEELSAPIINKVLGCMIPMTANSQKNAFQTLVMETFGKEVGFNTIKRIHEDLTEIFEDRKDEDAVVTVDIKKVRDIFESHGATSEQMEGFDTIYHSVQDTDSFVVSNVINTKKVEVKTPDISIKVAPDKIGLVSTKVVDGVPSLVIELSDYVEMNGLAVKPLE